MAARSLALVSLVVGLLSLPTAGGMGLGALAGLVAGILAFTRLRRAGTREGQKMAVAGIALNLVAAVVAVPLAGVLLALYEQGALVPAAGAVSAAPAATAGSPGSEREREPEPVRSDPELREPRKLHHVPPVYPEDARRAGVQGTVVLEAVIGTDGQVQSAKVLRGVPELEEAALDAARQWRYEPTVLRGQRVPVVLTVTINFRLR